MGSKICKQGRIALKGALASVLAFLAFVMCLPQLAFAEEAYQTIDGVMTITMQSGGASGGADGGASSAIATSATGTSGASSSVLTGDTLIWLILGIVVLLAGAVYIIVKSRRLASVGAPAGASATGISADTTVSTTTDSSAENFASAKRKTIIVAVITALIACACFGMFASKSSAFAKDYLEGITGTSNIVVDEQGNVINNDLTIANNSGQAIFITNIQAPEELNGWNANIKDETVESGSSAKGAWDGKTIPASVLEQVKNNSSSRIELALKININKALDFDTFSFDAEGLIYNGEQITPAVTSDTYKQGTDFEVVYGENKNAGEGTITIKGIGDYKGEKTYTFAIGKAPLTVTTGSQEKVYDNTPLTYDNASVEGLVNGESAEIHATGSQTEVGSSLNTYEINWTGTAKQANYTITKENLGTLTVKQSTEEIVATAKGGTFTYDGQAHGATVEVSTLPSGYSVRTATSNTNATDVNGDGITANVDNLVIVNAQGEDVTKDLNITRIPATIKITPATLTVVTPSANKQYDGTALTANGAISGLVNNETATFATTGAQTNAGESKNSYTIDWNGTAKQSNYTVSETIGTLKVTKASLDKSLTLTPVSAEKVYDGIALTASSATASGLPGGNTVKIQYSIDGTNWTENASSFSAINVSDSVTVQIRATSDTNYEGIVEATAPLKVSQRAVALTSESKKKTYDGTALTKPDVTGWEQSGNTGFVTGEVTSVKATGSVTNVSEGEVTNAITYDTASSFNPDNYIITKEEGTLSIAPQSIISSASSYDGVTFDTPENVAYDGKEHKWAPTIKDKNGKALVENTDYELTYDADGFVNAGSSITVSIKGINNYKDAAAKVYQITKASLKDNLTLTPAPAEKTYDGSALTANPATASGLPEGNTVKIQYSIDGTNWTENASSFSATNVSDSATVQIRATSDTNYEGTVEATAPLTITAAPLIVTTGSQEKIYDGSPLTYDKASVEGIIPGETLSIHATGSQTEVGSSDNTYEIKWDGTAKLDNYTFAEENLGTLTVKNFEDKILVTATGGEFTYDGMAHGATVSVGTLPAGYKVQTALSNTTATDVNGDGVEAKVDTLVILNAQGEDVTTSLNIERISGTIKIIPATLTVTTPSETKPYDGKALTSKGTAEGFVNGETATVTTTGSQTDVGESSNTYFINWNGSAKQANYTVNENVGTLTVTKAPLDKNLTLTPDPAEKIYDGTPLSANSATASALPEGNVVKIEYSLDGETWTETARDFSITNVSESTNVKIRATSDANYEGTAEATAPLKITQRTVNLKSEGGSKVYDGTALTKSVVTGWEQSGDTGFITNEVSNVHATGSVSNVSEGEVANAITYDTASSFKADNYTINKNEGMLSITAQSITPDTQGYGGVSITMPENVSYDSKEHKWAPAVTDKAGNALEEGTDYKVAYSTKDFTNAGTIKVTIEGAGNYAGTVERSYKITKTVIDDVLTLTPASASKTYDGTPLVASPATASALPAGNAVKIEYSTDGTNWTENPSSLSITNVSQSTDVQIRATSEANYEGVVTTSALLSITPAPLEVTTGSAEKAFDNTPLTCRVASISGFANRETATISATGSQTDVGSSANTYEIKWDDTAKQANYTIVKENLGTLTVKEHAKEITATATGGTFTYDGQAHGATVAVTGLPDEYTVQTAASSATATDVNGDGTTADVDNLVIVNAQGEDVTDSLNIKRVSGTIKITPATLTVTTPDATKDYDGTALTADGAISGFVNNETATFATTGSQTNVGTSSNTYSIGWSGTAKQANYNVSENLGTLEVTKSAIKINVIAGSAEKTYDGTALASDKATVTDLPDNLTYKAITSGSQTDAGDSENTVTEFKIFDPSGNEVTEYFTGIETNLGILSVNKRAVTLASESATKTYDGTALTKPDVTGWEQSGNTGFLSNEVSNVRATGSVTNVSEGEVTNAIAYDTASGFKADNYTITKDEGKLSVTTQSITPKTSTYGGVEISTPENTTYNGEEQKWSPEVKDKAGNTLTENTDYKVTYNTENFTNVATIKVTVEGVGNYAGTIGRTYQINKAPLTITGVTAENKDYDASTNATLNTENMQITGIVKDDQVTANATGKFADKNAGTRDVKISYALSGEGANNYRVDTDKSVTTVQATINKIKASYILPDNVTAGVGETLADAVLPTYKNGTITWKDKTTSVGTERGTFIFPAIFTPKDTTNYTTDDIEISVRVDGKVDFAMYSNTDKSLTFYNDVKPVEGSTYDGKTVTAVYDDLSSYKWSDYKKSITSVTVKSEITAPESMRSWFEDCESLTSVDLSKLDTSNVTSMHLTFYGCKKLKTVKGLTNVSNVKDMFGAFCKCTSLKTIENTASWDTSNVEDMGSMFQNCESLESINNIENWNTGNVTDVHLMFYYCSKLTADCSQWSVEKVGIHRDGFVVGAQNVKSPWDLDPSKITIDISDKDWTGEQITPEIVTSAYKKDIDYEVTYGYNTDPGTQGTIKLKGVGLYSGQLEYTFNILSKGDISNAQVFLSATSSTFTGETIYATADSVALNGVTLDKSEWEVMPNSSMSGWGAWERHTVYISGKKGGYTGVASADWYIQPQQVDMSKLGLYVEPTSFVYDGNDHYPSIKGMNGRYSYSWCVFSEQDYDYPIYPDLYWYNVELDGNYIGSISLYFSIVAPSS